MRRTLNVVWVKWIFMHDKNWCGDILTNLFLAKCETSGVEPRVTIYTQIVLEITFIARLQHLVPWTNIPDKTNLSPFALRFLTVPSHSDKLTYLRLGPDASYIQFIFEGLRLDSVSEAAKHQRIRSYIKRPSGKMYAWSDWKDETRQQTGRTVFHLVEFLMQSRENVESSLSGWCSRFVCFDQICLSHSV